MNKRKILATLLCFIFVCTISLTTFVPAFASEYTTTYYQPSYSSDGYRAVVVRGDDLAIRSSAPVVVYLSQYDLTVEMLDYLEDNWDVYATFASFGDTYKVTDAYDDPALPYNGYLCSMYINIDLDGSRQTFGVNPDQFDTFEEFYGFFFGDSNETFFDAFRAVISEGGIVTLSFQGLSPNPGFYVISDTAPLYSSAWDLLVKFVYGEGADLTPEQNLTLTFLATIAVLAVVLVPFAIVYFVLKFIFGWR